MKVLLVAPTFKYRSSRIELLSFSDFPSGIAYVAGALKQAGHEVIGLNPNNQIQYDKPYYMLTNLLNKALAEYKPDMVGLGGLCIDYQFFRDAIDLIRRFAPKTPIVLGGGIVNNDREFIFEHLKPDYAIVGEAEDTVALLANSCAPSTIDNLSWWDNGKPIHNKLNHNYRPIDERPWPDYDVFGCGEMIEKLSGATRLLYRSSRLYPKVYSVLTARHCPFSCSFCVHRSGIPYRARSMADVMEEIRVAWDKYHFNVLLLLDELFAANKQRMNDFSNGVLEGKEKYGWDFDWTFQTHASAALDEESLRLAKKAGLYYFSYGIESGSQTVLDSMNKRVKVSQIEEGIKMADKVGVGFGGNLIFGDTAETQHTIRESLDFYGKYGTTNFIFLAHLCPYPGNKLFDTCVEKGLIGDKAAFYANIDNGVYNMTGMSNPEWFSWVNFFATLEPLWFWVKTTTAVRLIKDKVTDLFSTQRNADYWIIEAVCPHCGEDIQYRESLTRAPIVGKVNMGTGCTKCGKRIRVEIGEALTKAERETLCV